MLFKMDRQIASPKAVARFRDRKLVQDPAAIQDVEARAGGDIFFLGQRQIMLHLWFIVEKSGDDRQLMVELGAEIS